MYDDIPKSDLWVLIDNDVNSQYCGRKFKFDFYYIKSDNIRNVFKVYIWRNYKEGNKTLNCLYKELLSFKTINKFLLFNNIPTLKILRNNNIEDFIVYLRLLISPLKKKCYSISTQRSDFGVLKNIIHWGQLYMPNEVPKVEIFTGNEYAGANRKLKIDFIPDEVVIQINKALKNEENPYLKYGIIILQSTGMRIGDMLELTIDCIKPHLISGYTLTWYDHKNRKERPPMPIPNECAIAVQKLIDDTKVLRVQANEIIKNYLFIYKISRGTNIRNITKVSRFTYQSWFNGIRRNHVLEVKGFIHKHSIINSSGELYNITGHGFRRTLATDMLSKGININVIRDVLGHSDCFVTSKHYADVKDKERAEVFKNIGIIGNINKVDETVIDNKQDLIWLKENKNKGAKMEDGYCTKPCSEGKICERLLKRQKCYTCSRYITTLEYLQTHKNHLAELEKQLEGNIYGGHYAEHFIPTIEVLREIVKRLEEIQDDYGKVTITTNNC